MAFNNLDEALRIYQEEQKKLNPDALPDDGLARLSDSDRQNVSAMLTGTPPTPELTGAGMPDPIYEAPPVPTSSSFDVHKSDATIPSEGQVNIPDVYEPGKPVSPRWELETDEQPLSTAPTSGTGAASRAAKTDAENAALLGGSDNDKARREAELAELEAKRRRGMLPQVFAGASDAINAASSAFGGNAPGGALERLRTRQDREQAQGKLDIENRLRDDAESDISKQYQALVAEFLQTDPSDPQVLGLTANQIDEKLPQIEKLAAFRHDKEMKTLAAGSKDAGFTPAQKTFDQEMAKLAAEFTDSGGIKAAQAADNQLRDTITRFKDLDPGFMSRMAAAMAPDAARGLMQPEYKAIEQEVRQNVTDLLRSTLGAQFTEREGERIFSQTFDPTLSAEINQKRMEALRTKLHTIAEERARAVEYFTKNKTFDGYRPQSNPNWTYGTSNTTSQPASRQTKAGYEYEVE